MSDLKIRDGRTIITHQPGARTLTVVKVETDEPELYGLGCASFFDPRFSTDFLSIFCVFLLFFSSPDLDF